MQAQKKLNVKRVKIVEIVQQLCDIMRSAVHIIPVLTSITVLEPERWSNKGALLILSSQKIRF